MSGRPNKKWMQTMIKKYGSREAVISLMRSMASTGGKNSKTGGFASDKVGKDGLTGTERARIAGAKGGHISRRLPKKIQIKEINDMADSYLEDKLNGIE